MKLNSNLTERESKHNMVETDNSAVQIMQVIPAYNSDIHILCEDKQQLKRTVLARVSELKDLVNRTETVDALNVMLQNVHVSNHTVGKELERVQQRKKCLSYTYISIQQKFETQRSTFFTNIRKIPTQMFKITLFIRIKHNNRIFGVIPFTKLQNNT